MNTLDNASCKNKIKILQNSKTLSKNILLIRRQVRDSWQTQDMENKSRLKIKMKNKKLVK